METCNTDTLDVYVPSETNPWDKQKAHHLYRRLTFGARSSIIDVALTKNPEQIVDLLVDEAVNVPVTTAPLWAGKGRQQLIDEGFDFEEINQEYKKEMYDISIDDLIHNNLRSMLTLFWHNHFVTQMSSYNCASYMYQYYTTLQKHAIGNFQEFTREIGITYAMLRFLNGASNKKNKPNENYSRELYELFTLGENNGYTQADIEETSKALTGYNNGKYCEKIEFDLTTFNDSQKTIFEQTGNWGYDDAINILFEQKAPLIAKFIVEKLYKYFVSPQVNEVIVIALARDFEKDFEIEPILRKLFKSEHFFNVKSMATIIKSPIDLTINLLKVTGFPLLENHKRNLYWQNTTAGQQYFQPVDVAGWQGDYDWINTSTITARWEIAMNVVWKIWNKSNGNREKLRDFAKEVSGNSGDVNVVVRSIIDAFLPTGFNTEANYQEAIDIFKTDSIPSNYFEDGTWTLDFETVPWQMVLLFQYIVRIPELQLK